MNAPSGKLTGDPEIDLNLIRFYWLRSEILDLFSDIEEAIIQYIANDRSKSFCSSAPLGQKVEYAKGVKAGPQRSKELKAKADQELEKLTKFLSARASIVHSRMKVAVTTDGQLLAIFRNAKNIDVEYRDALVFNETELNDFVQQLAKLGSSISSLPLSFPPLTLPYLQSACQLAP